MAEIEPPSLLTLTIRGRELERSIGSRAWITRQGPNRLTSIASATVPSSALLAVAHRSYMVEALFTSTSVRPNRSFTQSAIAATLIELSTSSWQATIREPSGSSSLAAISPLRRSREPSTTPKPSRASWRHTSRPNPRFPPVTTATGMSKATGTTSPRRDRDLCHGCHLAIHRGRHWLIHWSQLGETAPAFASPRGRSGHLRSRGGRVSLGYLGRYCQVTTSPSFSPKRSRCRPVTSLTWSRVGVSSAAATMTRASGSTMSGVAPPNPHVSTVPAGDCVTSIRLPKWLASCLRYRSPRFVATRAVEVTVIPLGDGRDHDDDRDDDHAHGDEHGRRGGEAAGRRDILITALDKRPEAPDRK